MNTEPFATYETPYGLVEAHDAGCYLVRRPSGEVEGFAAHSGDPSPDNAEADIAYALANPPAPPPPPPHRVSKDTLWTRLKEAGYRAQGEAFFASLTGAPLIDWQNQSWFWSNNEPLRAILGGDPEAGGLGIPTETVESFFAPDPHL